MLWQQLTIDLRGVPTTLHADADVHVGEALAAQQQYRLEDFVPQHLGLHKLDRAAVDLDQAAALFAVRDRDGGLLTPEGLNRLRAAGQEEGGLTLEFEAQREQ